MLNISFLTHNEVGEYLKENKKHSNFRDILMVYENTEPLFYKFSLLLLKKMPDNLISHLSKEDFINFFRELYVSLNDRRKKRFFIKSFGGMSDKFTLGNMSVITITTDDRPFLVDSLREYFYEIDMNKQFIVHPILNVKRNLKGDIVDISEPYIGSNNESFVMIFLPNTTEDEVELIKQEIEDIYENVILVVDDYPKMSSFVKQVGERFRNVNIDTYNFLSWLADDNFIIQGVRVIGNVQDSKTFNLEQMGVYKFNRTTNIIPSIIDAVLNNKVQYIDNFPLIIDKAIFKSKVKKRANYDRVILVDKSENGLSIITIIGVFTKDALRSSPFEISLVRNKVKKVIDYFGFVNGSHDYKWMVDILDTFPKTEIFNFDENTLKDILETIFSIQGKNQIRMFYKTFLPQKNLYLFLALPSEKYSSELVKELKMECERFFNAKTVDISLRDDDHGYEFIHFHFYTKEPIYNVDEAKLKSLVADLIKDWDERLYELINSEITGHDSDKLYDDFVDKFSENYKVKCSVKEALNDIKVIIDWHTDCLVSSLYMEGSKLVIKIYRKEKMLLTDIMPIIDNMGLKVNEEDIFYLSYGDGFFIHNIYVDCIENVETFYNEYNKLIPELVKNVIAEYVENDILNRLIISSKLNYREVDLLRGIRNYLEQINGQLKKNSIDDTLLNNSEISFLLIQFFNDKFQPGLKNRVYDKIRGEILDKIEKVTSVVEDRILRCFVDVLTSMCRTNFFLNKNYISFKISSKSLSILPEPKPLYEIYVHSAKMEGIHLRGGKVARGGIRFSDRYDDFRTEILGLMKTQMVKNTVIVPVGSKGGFIVKKRYEDREKDKNHVIEQYKTLMRGLLDITDNYIGKKVVHPEDVVIYDGKDPYLVVAADKGTATFSDIANSVSLEYRFWLGDAFASGGSVGYDHKKVGITAKGAWESVKRHFRELGKDIQKEEFTVIGIGDMSGDVFGNGMLLSKKIRLIAAFNHMHIFIDPDPDAEKSFKERERLFKLPRSTWMDYDKTLISHGGGIFERSAKKIELSKEIKDLLKIEKDTVTGEELIKYILKSEAELLWNGGIGTYVKDSTESNSDVGDKVNDNVRIDAEELKVKVVGEGGNLGFTQRARIKFSLLGGKINTDALDNSAGVDMSDHEVNLKILFEHLIKSKVLKDIRERNKLVAKLTNEVTDLVLRDNFEQSRIVSIEEQNASNNQLVYAELANYLKDTGLLKFDIERIEFITENRKPTRPEIAVLLAYTKLYLFDQIVEELDISNKIASSFYESYYPKTIIKDYREHIYEHKLVREICATVMLNKFINQNGIVNFLKLHKAYGKPFSKIIQRYFIADELFNIKDIRSKIDDLDAKSSPGAIYAAIVEIEKTLNVATEWLLHDSNLEMLDSNLDKFKQLLGILPNHITGNVKKAVKKFESKLLELGLPSGLVSEISKIRYYKPVFDLFEIVLKYGIEPEKLVKNYYNSSDIMHFKLISNGIKSIEPNNRWDYTNKEHLFKKVKDIQKKIAYKTSMKDNWLKTVMNNEDAFFVNYFSFLKSIEAGEKHTLIPFNVVLESLDKIVELW